MMGFWKYFADRTGGFVDGLNAGIEKQKGVKTCVKIFWFGQLEILNS